MNNNLKAFKSTDYVRYKQKCLDAKLFLQHNQNQLYSRLLQKRVMSMV